MISWSLEILLHWFQRWRDCWSVTDTSWKFLKTAIFKPGMDEIESVTLKVEKEDTTMKDVLWFFNAHRSYLRQWNYLILSKSAQLIANVTFKNAIGQIFWFSFWGTEIVWWTTLVEVYRDSWANYQQRIVRSIIFQKCFFPKVATSKTMLDLNGSAGGRKTNTPVINRLLPISFN